MKKITVPTALVSNCYALGDLGGKNLGCPSENSQVRYSFVINENGFAENGFFLISVQILLVFSFFFFIDPLRRILIVKCIMNFFEAPVSVPWIRYLTKIFCSTEDLKEPLKT